MAAVSSKTFISTRPTSFSPTLSFQSNIFKLRLSVATSSSSSLDSTISVSYSPITARYGGGGNFPRPGGGGGDFRSSRQEIFDDDQSLDIAGIRSPNVRLIDDKQNMVGIVSKNEALKRAEDAELDLVEWSLGYRGCQYKCKPSYE